MGEGRIAPGGEGRIVPVESRKGQKRIAPGEEHEEVKNGLLQGENRKEKRTDFSRVEQEGGKDVFVNEKNGKERT